MFLFDDRDGARWNRRCVYEYTLRLCREHGARLGRQEAHLHTKVLGLLGTILHSVYRSECVDDRLTIRGEKRQTL